MDIYLNLFDQIVLSVLLYGCEVLGYENIDILEIFFRSFLKKTLKLNDQTANCMVYGESGRKPLYISIQLRMVNFWLRIITGNENKLVYQIYKLLLKMHINNEYSCPWIKQIKNIFDKCGMRYIRLNPHNHNPIIIKKSNKTKVK